MSPADLLSTPSFWTGPVAWAVLASLCAVLCGVLIRWRGDARRLRRVWYEADGAAVTIDFLLIVPVGLLVISLLVQALVLAHQSLVVHAAAYSAARSTLAHGCPPTMRAMIAGGVGLDFLSGCDDDRATERALLASQTVLVAAAASSDFARDRGGCPDARDTVLGKGLPVLLEGAGVRPGLRKAVDNKICYVLETANVTVETDWQGSADTDLIATLAEFIAGIGGGDDEEAALPGGALRAATARPPVKATVRFRYPVTTPVGMLLADGRRADGTRWREGVAAVVLQ